MGLAWRPTAGRAADCRGIAAGPVTPELPLAGRSGCGGWI